MCNLDQIPSWQSQTFSHLSSVQSLSVGYSQKTNSCPWLISWNCITNTVPINWKGCFKRTLPLYVIITRIFEVSINTCMQNFVGNSFLPKHGVQNVFSKEFSVLYTKINKQISLVIPLHSTRNSVTLIFWLFFSNSKWVDTKFHTLCDRLLSYTPLKLGYWILIPKGAQKFAVQSLKVQKLNLWGNSNTFFCMASFLALDRS